MYDIIHDIILVEIISIPDPHLYACLLSIVAVIYLIVLSFTFCLSRCCLTLLQHPQKE